MNRRDYERAAKLLQAEIKRGSLRFLDTDELQDVIELFCKFFKDDSKSFDAVRFQRSITVG